MRISLSKTRERFSVAAISAVFALFAAGAAGAETIDDVLRVPELKATKVAVVIHDLKRDAYLYNRNRDESFIPASNMKLVTGAAAIIALGLNWQFQTDFYADAVNGGAVGNLLVVGHGDPTLSEDFFPSNKDAIDAVAREIAGAGVRSVAGDIIVDDSFFPPQGTPEGWQADDLGYCYAPVTGALSVAGNCLKALASASSKGVSVEFNPPLPGKYVIVSVSRKSKGNSWLSISATADGRLKVSGAVRSGRSAEAEYRVKNPAELFGWALESSLARMGVKVTGRVVRAAQWKGDRSKFDRLARYSSIALPEIVEEMLRESDNFVAEHLLRAVGGERGKYATTAGGAAATVALMREFKISTGDDLVVYDGSGLSRLNRMTPGVLDRLLKGFQSSYMSDRFLRMLASPGQRGTLKKRLVGTEAEGRLWAKTGALRGACSLSGYFMRPDGSVASFVMFFNGYTVHSTRIRELQDRIVKVMLRL